ncbi:SH3 domain-containing protein [Desulforamulus hydrothermalis]|uniref:N-acetylmuramoyl-L-alanine amidase n=1 Tax=Desulforamulus hydrothermalis Lam5 = DSM 18033 TaxID=1121428 RepID=K8E8W7_9FIRM|nr:SH3 domain-containing protein [Desulforamulus hydrothermalis]CCO07958.1 N-acetylmuramoyl-L-alanine amidase [Desulforamulus hydrothermalis Lam5 = DSM 18033]SHG85371.1 N-acetylmuramoyl-L-alanine amidase [Desulforamulus hydrothermalis Lam5 = DSM 18033]
MTFNMGKRFLQYTILAGFFVFWLIGMVGSAEAAWLATVKADKLNLRSGPGTHTALLGQVNKGDKLPVLTKSGDWYQVQVGGKAAWVAGWLVTVEDTGTVSRGTASTAVQGKVAVVTADTLNIRSGPGTNYSIAGQAKKGEQLSVLAQNGDWVKVQGAGTTGWVANWLVKVQNATAAAASKPATTSANSGKVAVATGDILNIRSGPGTGYSIVAKVKKGDLMSVLGQNGDWVKVQLGGTVGWVANWLVTVQTTQNTPTGSTAAPAQTTPATGTQLAVVNGDNINLRSGPGTQHSVAGQVSRGVRLPVVSRSGDWVQVRREDGTTAWVAGWLVSYVSQPEPQPQPSNDKSWLPGTQPAAEPAGNQGAGEGTEKDYVPQAKLLDVQISEQQGHTYINIVCDHNIQYNTFTLSNPYRFVVNLMDIQLADTPAAIAANTELVQQIRTGYDKEPYVSRLVVDLKKPARVTVKTAADKKSITLEITKISYSDGLAGKKIFLDAGHGGYDNGASGKNGLKEKDVNLDITLKVADILRQQGANVFLSRSEDIYVDLYERTRLANELSADIFVSIHSNANPNTAIGGTSTYYYAPSTMPALYDQRDDRRRLAEDVQRELVSALGRRDIGVLQANFAVLRTSLMPSILIETAFISNAEEEALLAAPDFRQRAAEAVARGISSYFSGQ